VNCCCHSLPEGMMADTISTVSGFSLVEEFLLKSHGTPSGNQGHFVQNPTNENPSRLTDYSFFELKLKFFKTDTSD
jgi:hypothetical protein